MSEAGDVLRRWAAIADAGYGRFQTEEGDDSSPKRPHVKGRTYMISGRFFVPCDAASPAPCRCGLTSGHEPTCPEVE